MEESSIDVSYSRALSKQSYKLKQEDIKSQSEQASQNNMFWRWCPMAWYLNKEIAWQTIANMFAD